MSFIFNEETVQTAINLRRLYSSKAPAITVEPGADPVRTDDVINPNAKLGVLDSPLVLAVMAAKDPFEGMSLAASIRMMPAARHTNVVGGIVGIVGEVSKHEVVQESCDTAVREEFNPKAVTALRTRAVSHISNIQQLALTDLVERVRLLSESRVVDEDFVDEVFQQAFRCDLRTNTFRDMLAKVLLSNKVRARVKLLVVDRLHLLPMQLRLELITKINALADDTDSAYIKREIEFTLRERGLVGPNLAPASVTKSLAPPRPVNGGMMMAKPSGLRKPTAMAKPNGVPWHEVLLRDKYAQIASAS